MTQDKFDNEKEIRRFLLGEMTETERAAFEEKFIAEDSGLVDEIGVLEDELIESYVRGTFSSADKTKFEQNFLKTDNGRRRVAFTREMFDKLAKESTAKKIEAVAAPSVWNNLLDLFKTPRLIFGAGFAILLVAFGLWFLVFKNSEKKDYIAQQITPTPTISTPPQKVDENKVLPPQLNVNSANNGENSVNKPETNVNKSETNKTPLNSNAENPNKNQPKEVISKPIIATIALFAGTVRSEGKMRELNLTKDTKGANFQLNLESRDYKIYRAEIVDADGGVIYRSGKIIARKSNINAYFPTAKLKKGDYFVKVYGFNQSGAEESAADFQFRVNQK